MAVAEGVGEAEMVEVAADPAGRAGRGARDRQPRRQRAHEIDRADDRRDSLAQRADVLLLAPLVEFGRKAGADALLDRVDELGAGEADIMFERFVDAGAMAKVGEQLGDLAVPVELAFHEHAVEVENDRLEPDHWPSNNAVPTRTAVAPSITAAL